MDELTAFVTARLDEDEARANAMQHDGDGDPWIACPATRTGPLGDLEWGEEHCWCGLAKRKGRALREVAAKRAIVNNYVSCATADRYSAEPAPIDHFQDGLRWALEQLATAWSDHLDYKAKGPGGVPTADR